MRKDNAEFSRRKFLVSSGLTTIPFLTTIPGFGMESKTVASSEDKNRINFIGAGLYLSPQQYLQILNQVNEQKPIDPDRYGSGGITEELEAVFQKQTRKESAIYLPTGTMANQVAIKLLNGAHTKVIVPENSHIFRDEADAAQSVHNLRLVPIGKDRPYFNLDELKQRIDELEGNKVFKSGLGTVVIESPVRRANQVAVPIKTMEEISRFCKDQNYKLHLDGSRLHLASAFTKVPISEYASLFDTVYISLYKCLNAAGGAVLCGERKIIDRVDHQVKILGGSVFGSWVNTSVALHYIRGIEERFAEVRNKGMELISQLNQLGELNIQPIQDGTFVFSCELSEKVNTRKLQKVLAEKYAIQVRNNGNNTLPIAINEGILSRELDDLVDAWKSAILESI